MGGLELLNADQIQAYLPTAARQYWGNVAVLTSISSTNDYLLTQLPVQADSLRVCCAEQQTQGRGRQGRTWFSPFACNIYLSVAWHFTGNMQSLSGLSLSVGMAVARALRVYGISQAKVKWPNDIWVDGAKLGGILMDIRSAALGSCDVVIGIGINGYMRHLSEVPIEKHWTDIYSLSGHKVQRNALIAQLLIALQKQLMEFQSTGLELCVQQWSQWDALAGKTVQLELPAMRLVGTVQGINQQGALLLNTTQGIQIIHTGEVTVLSEQS